MTGRLLLKRYLRRNKESGRAFAARAGIHYSRVSRFLTGDADPGPASALAIESATDGFVPVESWWGGTLRGRKMIALVRRATNRRVENPPKRSE